MKKYGFLLLSFLLAFSLAACNQAEKASNADMPATNEIQEVVNVQIPENFVLIEGGIFQMGSPEDEAWRSEDETQHTVTVSDFYMSKYELTQLEYELVMGNNPSNFIGGQFPVESISWLSLIHI